MSIHNNPVSSITSNIGWSTFGQVATLLIGFTSSVVLARWLGPEARGIYALIVSTTSLLAEFLGGNSILSALTYVTGKKLYTPAQIAGHSLWIVMSSTIVLVVLGILIPIDIVDELFPGATKIDIWIIIALTIPLLLNSMITGILIGLNNIRMTVIISITTLALSLFLQIILLITLKMGLRGAILQLAISSSWSVVFIIAVMVWKTKLDLTPKEELFRGLAVYSGKIYPGYIGSILLGRVDMYLVALFAGPAAVGNYAIAKGLAEILSIIEQPIGTAVAPKVVSSNREEASMIVSRAFRATFWSSLLMVIIGICVSPWLIPLIYGADFSGAVLAFILLLPGILFLSTRVMGSFFSMQMGRPEIATLYTLFTGLVSLPIFYILTRYIGYLGAAIGSSLISILRGSIVIGLFIYFTRKRIVDIFIFSKSEITWMSRCFLKIVEGRGNWRGPSPPEPPPTPDY